MAAPTANPSSLAQPAFCRHSPEVGAVCGKAARTVLCGGRSAMSVPTATTRRAGAQSGTAGSTRISLSLRPSHQRAAFRELPLRCRAVRRGFVLDSVRTPACSPMDASPAATTEDLWVFAYGSLMWRPGFCFLERVLARLYGAHRAL